MSLLIEYHPNTVGSPDCLTFNVEQQYLGDGKVQYLVLDPSRNKLLDVVVSDNLPIHHAFFVNKGGLVYGVKPQQSPWQFIVAGQQLKLEGLEAHFYGDFKLAEIKRASSHTPQKVTNQAMILAAGFATRLEPISGELTGLSKPALPLRNNLSVIQAMVEHLISFGIERVMVNTSFLPEPIHQQLQQYANQIEIKIIEEEEPSGTAGGLLKAFDNGYVDTTKPILVVQGDAVSNFDLGRLLNRHQEKQADVTIAGIRVAAEDVHRFGIIDTKHESDKTLSGHITGFLEKPTLEFAGTRRFANTGFYVLNQTVFDLYKTLGEKSIESNKTYDFANHFFPVVLSKISDPDANPALLFWAEELGGFWSDIGAPREYSIVLNR